MSPVGTGAAVVGMANIPADLSCTRDHEWLRPEGDRATLGITDHAQRQLGDIVYAELPKVGEGFEAGDAFGSLESVKAVTEVHVPLTCSVVAVNEALGDEPEKINDDPHGDGWLLVVRHSGGTEGLMTAEEYESYLRSEADED